MSIERKSEDRGTKWENIKKKKKKNESKTVNSLQAANFFYQINFAGNVVNDFLSNCLKKFGVLNWLLIVQYQQFGTHWSHL